MRAADRRGVADVVTRQSAPERHRAPRPPRSPARGSERFHPASSVPVRDQDPLAIQRGDSSQPPIQGGQRACQPFVPPMLLTLPAVGFSFALTVPL
jgi:hypothetical protein